MEKTKIQWTDATWNPFHGCKKVSTECKFCYMYRDKERYGQNPTLVLKSKTKFYEPLKWKEPKLIFTCSWSDWFIEEGDLWRDELWKIIKATPHHTYQILTKRPERIKECLPADWGKGYDNVWLGVSVGTNESLKRCKTLNEIPAKVKFISAEPLLEDLTELNEVLVRSKFDWCIIGGESGNSKGKYRFRECKLEWINNIINACNGNDVKIFVKQLGTFLGKEMGLKDSHGGDMNEWPNEIQIREFPKSFNKNIDYSQIEKLSPFKSLLAKAILAGEGPKELATRIAIERNIPRPTAQAYVTMVINKLHNK
jgi:protein gp37